MVAIGLVLINGVLILLLDLTSHVLILNLGCTDGAKFRLFVVVDLLEFVAFQITRRNQDLLMLLPSHADSIHLLFVLNLWITYHLSFLSLTLL